ncbi:DUF815 domain-containing protein [Erythrobacter sp. THAF29]|uniref:DUF815 domain-containing protein n=1 Tax=Erythrobacter sp. THAF29 TaxID=2587851 RepID=UPI00126921CA|nr:DUF815 domain-containing protein [Erythrobacter sp. THAF29]QFT76358.1 hypothetical protein FIU90_02265 [Erythrobacter sp. THAF29]
MSEPRDPLERIAEALERLSPDPGAAVDWFGHPAYVWNGKYAREVPAIEAPALGQLRAIDRQKELIHTNIARLASGHAAHDMLLWGARGMGKSALLRAVVREVQKNAQEALALVQVAPAALESLPRLFATLSEVDRQFVIFIDDLGFAEDDTVRPRQLRGWLEGGVEARAANCRLAVTSNRRAILARKAKEQDPDSGESALNIRDAVDDALALADRFGLAVGFHPCSRDEYLEIVHAYADPHGLAFDPDEALAWALGRGQRSGRVAWQYVVELAGAAGKSL